MPQLDRLEHVALAEDLGLPHYEQIGVDGGGDDGLRPSARVRARVHLDAHAPGESSKM